MIYDYNIEGCRRKVIDIEDEAGQLQMRLGRVNYSKARMPLEEHIHRGMFEIVLIEKGRQIYKTGNKEYIVKSGEVFITFPDEVHSTGVYPEDKALVYYLIINTKDNFLKLGYDDEDSIKINAAMYKIKNRVFKGLASLRELFESIFYAYDGENAYKKTMMRNIVSDLLIKTIDCAGRCARENKSNMDNVIGYIDSHITENISIEELAAEAGLSETRFKMNFREKVGIPPREFILRRKVDKAKELLKKDKTVTDIAFDLGFSSSQYFSTVFKRFTFTTPSEYRRQSE